MKQISKKSAYKAPVVRAHGSIETMTQGGIAGRKLDATFSTGTDFGDLTFS